MEFLAIEQRCLIASFILSKPIQIHFLTSIPRIWQPTILAERFKDDTHRYISQVFAGFSVTDLRVTSYCSHTVAVTTVTFRQICPKRTLTLASTCQSFMQAVQHSVSGAVYISPIHMLQHSMLHSLECGVHTSPEEEDVQANSAVIPALRLQTFCFRPT